MDDKTRAAYWAQHQTDSTHWIKHAYNLAYSAQILFKQASAAASVMAGDKPSENELVKEHLVGDMEMYPVAFMLAGFALENMFKALRVAQLNAESPIVVDDQRFRALTDTHCLTELALQAGLEIDDAAKATLRTLEDCILWVGRYSRPKKAQRFMPNEPAPSKAVQSTILSASAWSCFERLFADAKDLIV